MIRLAGLDEMPGGSPERERVRRYRRERRPAHRRAMWIGGGSISIPGDPFKAGAGGPPPFSGNWADLFPGAFQVVQSDKGIEYGAVMRADAGNTSSVAFALTGASPAVAVPIWIRITAPGVGNVYYDGLGITPAMAGVTIVDSVNIVLTGAGAGMAITPGVGSQAPGDTWRATCSLQADQSGNGKNATQVTPANQPLVAMGPNGVACLSGAATGDGYLRTNALNLPSPDVTPYWVFLVLRIDVYGSALPVMGNFDFALTNQLYPSNVTGLTQRHQFNVSNPGAGIAEGSWFIVEIKRSNSAADPFKVGGSLVTGNAGVGAVATECMFQSPGSGYGSLASMLAKVYTPNAPDWPAIRAAVTAKYGPVVAV